MARLQLIEQTIANPVSSEISDEEGAAMARSVITLFSRWGLNDEQVVILLGGLSLRTWARWKKGSIGRLSRDLKTRLSNLMGIHKALRIIFTEKERAYGWIKRDNVVFGASALDIMLRGEITDLIRVRHYLEAVRG